MRREEAIEYLKTFAGEYLEMQGENLRRPIQCPDPNHTDNHPSARFDANTNMLNCFTHPDKEPGKMAKGFDLFHLIGFYENIGDFNEQLKRACNLFGVEIEADNYTINAKSNSTKNLYKKVVQKEEDYTEDWTDLYKLWNKELTNTNYWKERGLSLETCNRFLVGYCKDWRHPKHIKEGKETPPSERLILPASPKQYTARAIDPKVEGNFKKWKAGEQSHLFNEKALREAEEPIFIVEGEIDCLSIEELNFKAVALGSMAYTGLVLNCLKKYHPEGLEQPLIIALDNDLDENKGQKQGRELKQLLLDAGYFATIKNPEGNCKDANELLVKDRKQLKKNLEQAKEEALEEYKARLNQKEEEALEERKIYREANKTKNQIKFFKAREWNENNPAISTGFSNLDKALDGGLRPGIYTIGAISSLGKTSFILQIADYIASNNKDVLFFTLEMSQTSLQARSLSRYSYLEALRNGTPELAKNNLQVVDPKALKYCTEAERKILNTAFNRYIDGALSNTYFIERADYKDKNYYVTIEDIKEKVKKHIAITGDAPLVVIDFLQMLAPSNDRQNDKQNMDHCISVLRQIAEEYKAPIIAISSLNRTNYNQPISLEALKESGNLEYNSDYVIGLQYFGTDFIEEDKGQEKKRLERQPKESKKRRDALKEGEPLHIEAVMLKARDGKKEDTYYTFHGKYSYFLEEEKPEGTEDLYNSLGKETIVF